MPVRPEPERPDPRVAAPYRTDNIANGSSAGIELATALRTGWGFELRVAYTYLATQVLAVDGARVAEAPFQVGQPLLRRPHHQGSVDLLYASGRFSAFAHVGGRGRVLDVELSYGTYDGLFTNPGYVVTSIGASVRLSGPVALVARVNNLFNRSYEETFGFPALGRSALAGIRIAAGR